MAEGLKRDMANRLILEEAKIQIVVWKSDLKREL